MGISIELHSRDTNKLNSVINQLAVETGQTLREVLPSEMRLLAVGLASQTTPQDGLTTGLTGREATAARNGGRESRMNSVRAMIFLIYPPIGWVVKDMAKKNHGAAGSFAAAMDKKNYVRAQKLLNEFLPEMGYTIRGFDGGALHKAQAGRRITQRILSPSNQAANAYANRAVKMVGFVKGGYATGARQLGGTRGIPGYASRHNAPGTGTVRGDGSSLTVTLTNDVKYARKAIRPSAISKVLDFRERQITNRLEKIQTRKINKAMKNFK